MSKSSPAQIQELSELQSRVQWLDEERRKYLRRLAEIEQKLNAEERKRQDKEQQVQALERELNALKAQLTRLPQFDARLVQFKDEIVQMIEQYDARRVNAQEEAERRRRVEQEVQAREMADLRKELPAIGRLEEAMEQRQAEESRLAHLIGVLQNRVTALDGHVEEQTREVTYAGESIRQANRVQSELQAAIYEVSQRWEPINARIDAVAAMATRVESSLPAIHEALEKNRQTVNNWAEQVQLGEYQRNQRLEDWRRLLDEQQGMIDQFRREWVSYADQYKEAKMAVQTMSDWQKHVEDQQREAAEMTRVEVNRVRSRWDEYLLEVEKRWKNLEVDTEQRWAAANRFNKQLTEQLHALGDDIKKLEQERDVLWRIQSAQTDALKQLPRIWQEEVEKAISQNPNRRRQPTVVSTPSDDSA